MSDKFAAAQRIAGLMPKDIRALDDESTLKLIADLATIGACVTAGMHVTDPPSSRAVMSRGSYWVGCLRRANSILRGEDRAPDPGPCPPIRKPPMSKSQRLSQVADSGKCGITATEANQFLAGLPAFNGENE